MPCYRLYLMLLPSVDSQGPERCLCSQLWGPPESPMSYVPGWQGIWETQTERVLCRQDDHELLEDVAASGHLQILCDTGVGKTATPEALRSHRSSHTLWGAAHFQELEALPPFLVHVCLPLSPKG